jgi:rod shape-determining protein MreC
MAMGAERYGSRADTVTFGVCLVLALLALALPNALRSPIAGTLRRSLLAPVLAVEREAVRVRQERQNVLALRAERDSLALAAAVVPELQFENGQLRALLRLGTRLRYGYVGAEVLHQTGMTDGLTLLLSVGRREGVVPMSPVVAPAGVVGVVVAVDRRTSIAMAWTHPDFRVSGMVADGRVFGIVASRPAETAGEMMVLRGVAFRDALPPGTAVVTSGLGGVYPRGIPVGTVQGVLSESSGWERSYVLRPAVHPAQVSHVMVLSPRRAADTLTAAFDSTFVPARSSRPR